MRDTVGAPGHSLSHAMTQSEQKTFIAALQEPARYPHPVSRVQLFETHANWILLAGDYGYKIKKPVDFGFLDFSSLAARKFFCEEEIRLNQRLAPELYLRVVPITGSYDDPQPDGEGEAIEHAVLMRRFDPEQRLDHCLARGEVQRDALDAFAADIARFHHDIPPADANTPYGAPQKLREQTHDNFVDVREQLPADDDRALLDRVEKASQQAFEALCNRLDARKADGHIRECHGDLHLGNLVFSEGRIRAFDCIEFNAELRWIDTASEIAFLLMDLRFRGRADLAARWRSFYLEWSGDYGCEPLLPFYEAYRAMVRARVAALTAAQQEGEEKDAEVERARSYLRCADAALQPRSGRIVITHGLSGSGKSRVAMALTEQLGALRLRSDVERKRLFGLDPLAQGDAGVGEGIYSAEFTDRTYQHLASRAAELAANGATVIVDATFLERDRRQQMRSAADDARVPVCILHVEAPLAILEERIRKRAATGGDASEADAEVLHHQLAQADPLSADERERVIAVDTSQDVDAAALAARIREVTS